ncbi:MAG TPA: hypothetical protein VFH25_00155 [Nitrososphaeraceae archaeon]|nr:hypothetical protein [Nitrososphaeraceae archaeon]
MISSAAHHQPEVAIAQPQQPQQPPQQGQLQSPNTAPPTLGKRTTRTTAASEQCSDLGSDTAGQSVGR